MAQQFLAMSAPAFPRIVEVPGKGSKLTTWVAYINFDAHPSDESLEALYKITSKKPWRIGTVRLQLASWDSIAIMQKMDGETVHHNVAQTALQTMLDSARVPACVGSVEAFVGYHLELIKKTSVYPGSSRYPNCEFSDSDAEEVFHLQVTHGICDFEKYVEEYFANKQQDALALPYALPPFLEGLKPHRIFWNNGMPETLELCTERQLSEKMKLKWVLLRLDKRVAEDPTEADFAEFWEVYSSISKVADEDKRLKACWENFSEHYREKTGVDLPKPKGLAKATLKKPAAASDESEGFFLTFGGYLHMTPDPLDI